MQEYFPKVYPRMFVGKYGGIAVGKGWFGILTQLCQNIQSHIDWQNTRVPNSCPQVTIEQVKEKFGSLRFYYQGGDEYIMGLVSMAESMTGITCEECGNPGETRHDGWVHVSCDACEAKREEAKLLREGFEQ